MTPAAVTGRPNRKSNGSRPRIPSTRPLAAGDPIPTNCELIEVHVSELKQLFNAIDPSPFRERDLDPNAEEFITDWAKEASPSAAFGLAVYLDRPAGLPNEPVELREAIHQFFRHRAELSRRRLRELLRRGRTNLVIAVCALGVSLAAGNLVADFFSNPIAEVFKEGLLIGGWVAMWRPVEIFLYDWWPIRAEAALTDRLSVMPVRISYPQDGSADAWRWDWPAASLTARAVRTEPTHISAAVRPHDAPVRQQLSHRDRLLGPNQHEGTAPQNPRQCVTSCCHETRRRR